MPNSPATKAKLNTDYIVLKKQQLYVIDKDGNRKRICVEYPIGLTTDDIEDILTEQSTLYRRLDGTAVGYVPIIKIHQRQKWQ